MTTAATSTVIDHTSDAGFRTWVAEIITMLFTTAGVTQTADTGQINTTTVTRPGASTMGGYVIGSFNDTLQATAPLFFKLQFGTGGGATIPFMQLQIGTGSNGSGTLTGVTTANVASAGNNAPSSTITPYVNRACYSTADGTLWLAWKLNGQGTTNQCMGGFLIARSNDNTGAPTSDSTLVLTTGNGAGAAGYGSGYVQAISHLSGASYSSGFFPSANWGVVPFNVTNTLFGGNTQAFPCFQYTPVMGISNWYGLAMVGEVAVGSTVSMALVGSTAHTYIAVGSLMGVANFTNNNVGSGYTATGGTATSYTLLLPWE